MEGYSFTEYFEKEVWIEGGMKQVMEAHRVVEVRGERLVTRGDSRPFRDRPWPMEWCRGRVVAVWRGNGLYEPPGRPSAWVRGRILAEMAGRAVWRRVKCRPTRIPEDDQAEEVDCGEPVGKEVW